MKEFDLVLDVSDRLLGENGCPWDREQTLFTLQPYLLEETHELIEAIDANDAENMKEELGDVVYTLIFIAHLAKEKGFFSLEEALTAVREKMIRRHPHIFGKVKAANSDEVMQNWEQIKKLEGKSSSISRLPPTLPALSRAQKVLSRLMRKNKIAKKEAGCKTEEELSRKIWELVQDAEVLGLDAESVLRRFCSKVEKTPEMDS